jgi:hypothetical protein
MFPARHSKLAKLVVFALLSFTALDLGGDAVAYPFCDSDLERALEVTGSVELAGNHESGGSNSAAVHIDDCFCCSRCVEFSSSFTFSASGQTIPREPVTTVSSSLVLAYEFYRPPRLS